MSSMFAPDKKKHFWAGLAISLVAGPFIYKIAVAIWPRAVTILSVPLAGFVVASVVGALKEIIWDWLLKKGAPEFLDFVATALGGYIGYLILALMQKGW
ncbi:MAG: hypothetical protein QM401_04230 [Bacillota bacterium]|nr:hypothetical protein [Bacillota bacterium]